MSKRNTLPDQNHIEQIRKRLWCDREFGQAAIMVGAGFSRNAKKISEKTDRFPLWPELAEFMFNTLYPQESLLERDRQILKQKVTSGRGAIRLASEYEAVFRRQALNNFLIKSIPDNKYQPDKLHELLLSLPWSDVFTTNYDTLLERTLPAIHERKYDLVLTISDIPERMKPRIVKLHGSFPSHRPFIITEEDYRTYPTKFAPFVNMVQQSIMENIFCLIGFTGDDPNFLCWSGWVRDNLGLSTPPIYLCGLLDLYQPQRRLLENRNIIPIDLSPLFPESDWPDRDLRYKKALEWFLLNLMNGSPPNPMYWPIPQSGGGWKKSDGLPQIPPGPQPVSDPGRLNPSAQSLKVEDLRNLLVTWRKKRQEYPGWVIAPQDNREKVWAYTEYWLSPVLDSIGKLPPPENILLLYELNWRLEITQMPLFMDWVEKITPIIDSFNPYPEIVTMKEVPIRPDNEKYNELTWDTIGKCWIELIFALAREAREDQDEKRFRLWMERIKNVVEQNPEWHEHWFFEECLFNLFQLNEEKVRKTLKQWKELNSSPFGKAKYASLLAELGDLKEAEKIAEEALAEIRTRIQPYSPDYTLLSQEGWVMVLLRAIKHNKYGDEKEIEVEYRNRWEKLRIYRCDPWQDIKLLISILKGPIPISAPEKEIKKQFFPGKVTVTHHSSSGLNISDVRPAFAFLRMFEGGALSMKCGVVDMFSDAAVNSAKWIEPFAPFWALSSMVRTAQDKKVKEWFNNVRMATLTKNEINYLKHIFNNSLIQSIQYLGGNPQQISPSRPSFAQRQATLISELLSYLCSRFSVEQLDELFNLTMEMYKLPLFRQFDLLLYRCIDILFKGLFYAMPQSKIIEILPELLSLPIPSKNGFNVTEPSVWIEPTIYIEWIENTKLDSDFDRSAWSAPITNLIRIARTGNPNARKRVVLRLVKINEINGLTIEEKKAFGETLWSRIDAKKDLPSDTGLYDAAFLTLPEIKTGNAKKHFCKYYLSTNFPRVVNYVNSPNGKKSKSVSIHGGTQVRHYIDELLRSTVPLFPKDEKEKEKLIEWSPNEATQLLKKAAAWWDDEKVELKTTNAFGLFNIPDILREQFSYLIQLMSNVILPSLIDVEEETKALVQRLISEMEQSGLCILSILPFTLFLYPNLSNKITEKLRSGLNSVKYEEVRDSIIGLFYWLIHSERQSIPFPPDDLLNEWVNKVVTRRQPGLNSAIGQLAVLIRRLPDVLHDKQMDSLCIALEYLLKETELPDRQEQRRISDLSILVSIPIDDRPNYRKLSAELAYWILIEFTKKKKEIPDILSKWKEVCLKDPFPEVRKVWHQYYE